MTEPFEKPARSCFNLTHYCKLLPESHALFVMPPGCSRILRLSALEEGISDRFTMFHLEPSDMIAGDMESLLIDGVRQTLCRLTEERRRPKLFAVLVNCVDAFIGTDHAYVFSELRAMAPDIHFLDLAVDPINRDTLPPLVRFHNAITALFEKTDTTRSVCWLGSYLPPAADTPLLLELENVGISSRHPADCRTLAELQSFGNSLATIVAEPVALPAAKVLHQRLGIPYFNLSDPSDPASMTKERLVQL